MIQFSSRPPYSSMLSRSSEAEVSWLSSWDVPRCCIPSTIRKYLSESFSAKRHLVTINKRRNSLGGLRHLSI